MAPATVTSHEDLFINSAPGPVNVFCETERGNARMLGIGIDWAEGLHLVATGTPSDEARHGANRSRALDRAALAPVATVA